MRVVVVGATGNVGSALLRRLAAEPRVDEIVGIARRLPAWRVDKTSWRVADVSRDPLEPLLDGADAVVHLAWLIQPSRDEATTWATNVEGSRRVFAAAAAARVGALVYASSIGAYAAGPKDRAVDESHPVTGIPTSFYSRHKAIVEAEIMALRDAHPELRVAWLRPGLIFQREAASGIRRLFVGPLLPSPLLRRGLVPVVPRHPRLRVQAVHADDVADAYRLAILDGTARGPYNVAGEPVLDGPALARLFGAHAVPVPRALLRGAASLSWRARLQPTPPGWLDLGLGVPLMDCTRARRELEWTPTHDAGEALLELFDGMREGAGLPTPPLDPSTGGPARVREVLSGVGGRSR
jgi:UDP-glucose 4-epimerase